MIYRKDSKADKLVQLYLSWFSLAKVIALAKPMTKDTFKSITDLPTTLDQVLQLSGELKTLGKQLISRYMPWLPTIPICQGISWEPTWKAIPNGRIPKDALYKHYHNRPVRSAFLGQTYELCAYGSILQLEHAHEGFFSSAILWRPRIRFACDPNNTLFANIDLEWFERWVGPCLPTFAAIDYYGDFGKLGMVIEGAGKRRIFAIGNYIKQRLCHPYHVWLMDILSRLPTDGTFDQLAPLDNLVGCSNSYSFDLK